MHAFEEAGLGPAPYTFLGTTDQPGHCHFCQTAIRWRFHLRAANGHPFYVGSDCIYRTEDTHLHTVADIEVRARRSVRQATARAERRYIAESLAYYQRTRHLFLLPMHAYPNGRLVRLADWLDLMIGGRYDQRHQAAVIIRHVLAQIP